MRPINILIVLMSIGVLVEGTVSLTAGNTHNSAWNHTHNAAGNHTHNSAGNHTHNSAGNHTHKNPGTELSRERRALHLIPIVLKLALGGAQAVAAYCVAQPVCCVASLINIAELSEKVLKGFEKAINYLNIFG